MNVYEDAIQEAAGYAYTLVMRDGLDSTIACIRASEKFGVSLQSVLTAYLWGSY